jgi:hypothetical protein
MGPRQGTTPTLGTRRPVARADGLNERRVIGGSPAEWGPLVSSGAGARHGIAQMGRVRLSVTQREERRGRAYGWVRPVGFAIYLGRALRASAMAGAGDLTRAKEGTG